jgi:hypothetical protein
VAGIERADIEEAFRRWQDFMALQPVGAALGGRAEGGDPLGIARLDAIRESVGVGRDTWLTFLQAMQRHMDEMPLMAAVSDDAGPEEFWRQSARAGR